MCAILDTRYAILLIMAGIMGLGRDKAVTVVDVGSGSVSAAIVLVPAEGPCRVLAHAHSALSFDSRSTEQAIAMISDEIRDAASRAQEMYTKNGHSVPIADAYAVVHGPWVRSRTLTTSARFEADMLIDDSMVSGMARQALADGGTTPSAALMEASVIRVSLNGYATDEPAGKYAHEIDVSIIASECEPAARANIQASIEQAFPHARLQWRSSVRAALTVTRHMRELLIDCLIVEMGMDSTDLIAVHNGAVTEERTVPEGARAILSRVAGSQPPETTLSLLRMLSRDVCEGDTCIALQKAVATAEPELAKVFGEAISALATQRRVGNELVLVAHPDLVDWFAHFFGRIDFSQFTITTLPFSVYALSSVDMNSWIDDGVGIDSSLAAGISLVNIEARN